MNWTDKYQLVGIKPGKVVLKDGSTIDFSDPNLKIDRVEAAYKRGTRFLKLKQPKHNTLKSTATPEG